MKALVLGSGGREHALAWRLAQDDSVDRVFVLPGNAGMELDEEITTLPGDLSPSSVLAACRDIHPALVVIGPERPLAAGLADHLRAAGQSVFGPSQAAARLESSKIFAKNFMQKWGIPTAPFAVYSSSAAARAALADWDMLAGIAIKADTLAAGKGVVVTRDRAEAERTIELFMDDPACPVKTGRLIIEKCLPGRELSLFALCDGENFFNLGHARDYKRVGEGDTGPNTGGMGCFTPEDWPGPDLIKQIEEDVLAPTLAGMKAAKTPFCGVLFAGLMIDGDTINVIEFNVRFGDPETQTLLPLVEGDFGQALLACSGQGKLADINLRLLPKSALHVVLASGGYPAIDGTPLDTGHPIHFESPGGGKFFFAGVAQGKGGLVNTGGRVMGLSVTAESVQQARRQVYGALERTGFEGAHFRRDIGSPN